MKFWWTYPIFSRYDFKVFSQKFQASWEYEEVTHCLRSETHERETQRKGHPVDVTHPESKVTRCLSKISAKSLCMSKFFLVLISNK